MHDAAWSTFRRQLEYKARHYGRELVALDRWLPTSQTCSTCGRIDGPKPLDVREWSCPCGAGHDRDTNAAKNILAAGRAERRNACGGDVRPHRGSCCGSRKQQLPFAARSTSTAVGAPHHPTTTSHIALTPAQVINWRKSSQSHENGCIEIGSVPGIVGVQDSKQGNPSPLLPFSKATFDAFIVATKSDHFNQ